MKGSRFVWLFVWSIGVCPLFGGADRGPRIGSFSCLADSLKASPGPQKATKPVVPSSSPSLLSSAKKDPVPGLNNAAITLSQATKNVQALSALNRAQQMRPSDTVAYNKALVLLKLKRFDEAAALLKTRPSFGHAQLNLGTLQCRQGDWTGGLKTLQTAPASTDWADEKTINVALAQYQLGQYAAAERTLAGATGPTAQLVRGDLALMQGFYADALKVYQGLTNDETYGRLVLVRMGNALLGMRKFTDAAAQFDAYLNSGDRADHASARLGLANAWYGQRDYSRAIAEFRAAVQLLPRSSAARTGLANAFASNGDYRSARTHYESVLRQEPGSLNARMGLGVVAYRQGKVTESAGHLNPISSQLDPTNADHADAYLHQGLMALSLSRFDTARRTLEIASRLRPGDPSAFSGLSEVFRRQELYGQALENLQQAITKTAEHHWPSTTGPRSAGPRSAHPPVMSAKTRARMQANRGSLLLKLNLVNQAYPVFKEALNDDPGNLNALNGIAVCLLEMDQLDKAQALYDSLINRGNRRAFLYNNRGIVRSYIALQLDKKKETEAGQKQYLLAKADYEKAQQLDTSRRFYQNNLGNALKNLARYDEAVKSYQAYLSKSAINNMGVLYAANRKPEFARRYMNLAIELDSNNLVFHYNRLKMYREFYADSLRRRPNAFAAAQELPTSSISAKYSRDGYINIYLYDYDFDAYEYPADHRFPLQTEPPKAPDLLPVDDFVPMPEPSDPVAPAPAVSSTATATAPNRPAVSTPPPAPQAAVAPAAPAKRARMPKPTRPRRTSRWGSTRCPSF